MSLCLCVSVVNIIVDNHRVTTNNKDIPKIRFCIIHQISMESLAAEWA